MEKNAKKNNMLIKISVLTVLVFLNFSEIKSQVFSKGVYIGDTTCTVQCFFENSDRKFIDTICLRSCIFIKFQIDRSGKPINIVFNNLAAISLRSFVTSVLESTAGKWIFTSKKIRKRIRRNEFILLPIAFSFFSSKCVTKDSSLENILGMFNFEPAINLPGEPIYPAYSKASYFNGILLNPVLLVSRYN
ncbi:MAG: hypothetical protein ACK52X_06455 [bacterium]